MYLQSSLIPKSENSARSSYKVIPHTKRIDMIYLHEVHGLSKNKIATTFDHHFITVNKIINTYMQQGRTSMPHTTNCPVSASQILSSEVPILDLKALENY